MRGSDDDALAAVLEDCWERGSGVCFQPDRKIIQLFRERPPLRNRPLDKAHGLSDSQSEVSEGKLDGDLIWFEGLSNSYPILVATETNDLWKMVQALFPDLLYQRRN